MSSSESLARVERQAGDEPIERRQQHEPLRAERDALAVEPEAGRTQPGLVDGDSIQHRGACGAASPTAGSQRDSLVHLVEHLVLTALLDQPIVTEAPRRARGT